VHVEGLKKLLALKKKIRRSEIGESNKSQYWNRRGRKESCACDTRGSRPPKRVPRNQSFSAIRRGGDKPRRENRTPARGPQQRGLSHPLKEPWLAGREKHFREGSAEGGNAEMRQKKVFRIAGTGSSEKRFCVGAI